jgi:hypothetical protein
LDGFRGGRMTWFSDNDSMKTVKDHIGGKHVPDSIREEAKQEYTERRREEGASANEIREELFDLDY